MLLNYDLEKILELSTNDEKFILTQLIHLGREDLCTAEELYENITASDIIFESPLMFKAKKSYLNIICTSEYKLGISNLNKEYISLLKIYFSDIEYDMIFLNKKSVVSQLKEYFIVTKLKKFFNMKYIMNTEKNVVANLLQTIYILLIKEKTVIEKDILILEEEKAKIQIILDSKIELIFEEEATTDNELNVQLQTFETETKSEHQKIDKLDNKLIEKKEIIKEITKKIDVFDNTIKEVEKQFELILVDNDKLIELVKLDDTSIYIFLKLIMKTSPMGILAFGSYSTATALYTIMKWVDLRSFYKTSYDKIFLVAFLGNIRFRLIDEKKYN